MLLLSSLLWACAFSVAWAEPSISGPVEIPQEDGSVVTVQFSGDNAFQYAMTVDGYPVVGNGKGSFVYIGNDGKPSNIVAKNADKRTESENFFLKKLDPSESLKNYRQQKIARIQKSRPSKRNGISMILPHNDAEDYVMGDQYFPVMVVETADYKPLDSAMFVRMFNEKGYKENGAYGSVRDYFIESSGGLFKPTFDFYSIKLPKNFSEYNSDSLFILPAIDQLVERDDFKARASKYPEIIPFVIMHPISKGKAMTYSDEFSNHKYSLIYSAHKIYSKNGYRFNNYAFVAQKAEGMQNSTSFSDVAMLGMYVHEFSHVLGLPDLYSVDSKGYATIGPLPYDVMAVGLRNGNGGYPPTFSAFEREEMGWLTPIEITNSDSVYVLKNLSKMQAYAVSNPNEPREYYIIEYRPAVGFDTKIRNSAYSAMQGDNGVMIWYIDYYEGAFWTNDPNGDVDHQRVEVKKVLNVNQEYYNDFRFVNDNGKAAIEGIFNLIIEGDDRVCFTVKRSKTIDKCPQDVAVSSSSEEVSSSSVAVSSSSSVKASSSSVAVSSSSSVKASSSSVAVSSSSSVKVSSSSVAVSSSSSVKVSSSSVAVSSSSSAKRSSSSSQNPASSSQGLVSLAGNAVPKVQIQLSSKTIGVEVPFAGKKTLRFYDALGNHVGERSFDGTSISVDVSGWNRTAFMQLDVNGRLLFTKRVPLH